jgi:hypothetical protein
MRPLLASRPVEPKGSACQSPWAAVTTSPLIRRGGPIGVLLVLIASVGGSWGGAEIAKAEKDLQMRQAVRAPLIGTWRRGTTCAELVSALTNAGLQKFVLEFVAGNGFIPGVTSPDQIADSAKPCAGAVPRQHSHFFTKNGAFGSRDWHGQQVDDGSYRIVNSSTVVISKEFPKVTFRYRIRGRTIAFTPVIPKGCSTFRCGWAISMAYPGKTWQRVG